MQQIESTNTRSKWLAEVLKAPTKPRAKRVSSRRSQAKKQRRREFIEWLRAFRVRTEEQREQYRAKWDAWRQGVKSDADVAAGSVSTVESSLGTVQQFELSAESEPALEACVDAIQAYRDCPGEYGVDAGGVIATAAESGVGLQQAEQLGHGGGEAQVSAQDPGSAEPVVSDFGVYSAYDSGVGDAVRVSGSRGLGGEYGTTAGEVKDASTAGGSCAVHGSRCIRDGSSGSWDRHSSSRSGLRLWRMCARAGCA